MIVSQRKTRRLGPSPVATAFGSFMPVTTLTGTCCTCSMRSSRAGGRAQLRALEPLPAEQIRRHEREQEREPDEARRRREPPPVADLAGEAHDDRERKAEERELAAEREPVPERHLR